MMAVVAALLALLAVATAVAAVHVPNNAVDAELRCSVVVAGGTTAAFAAAVTAAEDLLVLRKNHSRTGRTLKKLELPVCLIEPTDWPGGQFTANALPCPDFAHQILTNASTGFQLNVAALDQQVENMPPRLWDAVHCCGGNAGRCWVSPFCVPARDFLAKAVWPALNRLEAAGVLRVLLETVVVAAQTAPERESASRSEIDPNNRRATVDAGKTADTDATSITSTVKLVSMDVVTRKPRSGVACGGYDRFPSAELPDWYARTDSDRFTKRVTRIFGSIFIEATDWGELLALTGAPYLQGIDERWDGDTSGIGNDTCGQAFCYDFAETWHREPTPEPPDPYPIPLYNFSFDIYSWDKVFTYRRIVSTETAPQPNDTSIQNWAYGNDYRMGYLFLSKAKAKVQAESGRWQGGVNRDHLRQSEYQAFGYHFWFKAQAPEPDHFTLDPAAIGTCHGLAKLPYLRGTRRSIGVDDFVIAIDDISSSWISPDHVTGTPFHDRIAIGSYPLDCRKMWNGCHYPKYMEEVRQIMPYFIPLRAMTNKKVSNMLAAGKTMAQSFLSNAATRTHPVEWSSGTGCGAAAMYMVEADVLPRDVLNSQHLLLEAQARARAHAPLEWTINGKKWPAV